jgi:DNA-binding MarR family transcriptional regulator/GNAT superfamily N-acetyltransferase
MGDIEQVRRFNRIVTKRVGALDGSYLTRGRPLAEARIIHEIGVRATADLKQLRAALSLDSGYMSRLLRSLEAQGLVENEPSVSDARARTLGLTAAGEAEFAAYEKLSDRVAEDLLGALDGNRRKRLVAAMAEIERLLAATHLSVAVEDPGTPDGQWCLASYVTELQSRFETGFDPSAGTPFDAAGMPPPHGMFVMARLDGHPVGCGALKWLEGDIAEIKRVWTVPQARGIGVASRIMDRLEELARERGATRVRLDTNATLVEAQAMYAARGYREISPYNDNPYAQHWFEKAL